MKLILLTLIAINCLNIFVSSQEDNEIQYNDVNTTAAIESRSSTDEIYFDVTDLAVSYNYQNGDIYQLEAYKTSVNDKIIKDAASAQYNQLNWVSIGHPRIVKTNYATKSEGESKLFYFNNEGFYTYVSMLTDEHKQLFVNAVQQKYNVNINTHQIRIMPLEIFNCNIKINWEGIIRLYFSFNYQSLI
jgi:hypothetical protein